MSFPVAVVAIVGLAMGVASCGSGDDEDNRRPKGRADNGGSGEAGGPGGGESGGGAGNDGTGGRGPGAGGGVCVEDPVFNIKAFAAFSEPREYALFTADVVEPQFGDEALPDGLEMEFWKLDTGVIELGVGVNGTARTENVDSGCLQCVYMLVDFPPDRSRNAAATYFAESGSITVSVDPDPTVGWDRTSVKFNNVVFRQYDMANSRFIGANLGDCIKLNQQLEFTQ